MHIRLDLPDDLAGLKALHDAFFPADAKTPDLAENFSAPSDTSEETASPETEAPETAETPEDLHAPAQIAKDLIEKQGLKMTGSTQLADGVRGSGGSAAVLKDGSSVEIHATARGKVVVGDEDGNLSLVEAATVASDGAYWEAAEDSGSGSAGTPPDETETAPETPDGAAQDPNYLLEDLKTAGGNLKTAVNVEALFNCLHGAVPGAKRMSDVPVEKRAELLAAMQKALHDANANADVLS